MTTGASTVAPPIAAYAAEGSAVVTEAHVAETPAIETAFVRASTATAHVSQPGRASPLTAQFSAWLADQEEPSMATSSAGVPAAVPRTAARVAEGAGRQLPLRRSGFFRFPGSQGTQLVAVPGFRPRNQEPVTPTRAAPSNIVASELSPAQPSPTLRAGSMPLVTPPRATLPGMFAAGFSPTQPSPTQRTGSTPTGRCVSWV